MICDLMKQRFSARFLLQQAGRFIEHFASVPALALLALLSILFPLVLFPAHGIGDIKPLDLHFAYGPDQVYEYLAALGAKGRSAYSTMLLTSDLVFPVIYSMTMAIALRLVLRKSRPRASLSLCLFPFTIILADWFENLSLVLVTRKYPQQADVIAGYASIFTSLKWILIMLTVLILLTSIAVWVISCMRDR